MTYQSIFEQRYDVAIYGSGYAGLAAAWTLKEQGQRVLLFDRQMDIAWESGRAFARSFGTVNDPMWESFIRKVRCHSGESFDLEPTSAEIIAVSELVDNSDQIDVLLGASPMTCQLKGRQIAEVCVATKSGERTLRARTWLDASDAAPIFQMTAAKTYANRRSPESYEAGILLGLGKEGRLPSELTIDGVKLIPVPKLNAFQLCLRSKQAWSQGKLLQRWQEIREQAPAAFQEIELLALSSRNLPRYAELLNPIAGSHEKPDNIYSASPALCTQAIRSPAHRFQLGLETAKQVPASSSTTTETKVTRSSLPKKHIECDILVAGAGTGGSIAALTAQAEGKHVIVADSMPIAGGVGTAGLISNYFYGHPGGAHDNLDKGSKDMQNKHSIPTPKGMHWHPQGKAGTFENKLDHASNFIGESIVYSASLENTEIRELRIATVDQILVVHTRAVIDATGDGDVAALAGADYDFGRPGDGLPLSYSQPAHYLHKDSGRLGLYNFDAGWCDPTDPEDLSRARLHAIAQYRTLPADCEKPLVQLSPLLGVRQSRQFHTTERLELADLMNHTSQPHSIGFTQAPLDTHSVDFEFEDDETLFWLWGCKSFRHPVHAEMPYGIMTPIGLDNLWLACRSAGISPAASYAARMQRDMHRLGEAAAYAVSAWIDDDSTEQIIGYCQTRLKDSGALQHVDTPKESSPLEQIDEGKPGPHLWAVYQAPSRYRAELSERLTSSSPDVSWLAAVLFAMWRDNRAEARLLTAIDSRETGIPSPALSRGPFNQHIDVPNWFLAINLLRRCGTEACLPSLRALAEQANNCLNLRTSIAITITRLSQFIESENAQLQVSQILNALMHDSVPDTWIRPSHSITRTLDGESQRPLPQEPAGIDTSEDHSWQFDLTLAQAAQAWKVPCPTSIDAHLQDPRACMRKAFQTLVKSK